jgi:hypothetical protein
MELSRRQFSCDLIHPCRVSVQPFASTSVQAITMEGFRLQPQDAHTEPTVGLVVKEDDVDRAVRVGHVLFWERIYYPVSESGTYRRHS